MNNKLKQKQFNKALFAWHNAHYRDMKWRNTRDAYKILISEIMLQQTQVDRVREKYALFLKQFPNVQTLANAPLGEVLRAWSGLGYNRRAKYLQLCAKKVVEVYGGKFPKTYEELIALPGIGMSTAGALLAFAYNEDTPMIDTNIRRILTRVFFKSKKVNDKALYAFATTLIPKGQGRMWNYAMLDLGATLCTARNHGDDCPLEKLHGKVQDFSYKKPQKKFVGSDRFYRGRILARLTQSSASKNNLVNALGIESELINRLLEKLLKEELIMTKRGRFRLP